MTTLIKGLKKPITRLISRHNIAEVLNPLNDICNTIHNIVRLQPIYFTRRSYNIKLYLIKNTRTRHCRVQYSIFRFKRNYCHKLKCSNPYICSISWYTFHNSKLYYLKTWMFVTMGGKDLGIKIRVWWQQLNSFVFILLY